MAHLDVTKSGLLPPHLHTTLPVLTTNLMVSKSSFLFTCAFANFSLVFYLAFGVLMSSSFPQRTLSSVDKKMIQTFLKKKNKIALWNTESGSSLDRRLKLFKTQIHHPLFNSKERPVLPYFWKSDRSICIKQYYFPFLRHTYSEPSGLIFQTL